MNQQDRRVFLIERLVQEQPGYRDARIPSDAAGQERLLRALANVRMPGPIDEDFLTVQDEYLRERAAERGITRLRDLMPVEPGIYLWQGDITTLAVDAIVNAANSGMTGCYVPCHNCIDNCIHTFAGVQLRNACAEIMERQGHEEATGQAKITPGFNLPCTYVLHTVGPIVQGDLTEQHREQLESCYASCLNLAAQTGCESVAFCCISTGLFGFPQREAAEIAVRTVRAWRRHRSEIEVVFNVFKDEDREIYRGLLG